MEPPLKWIVISLFTLACALFTVGIWTRVVARSADERAGSAIPYMLAGVLLAIDIALIVCWAVGRLIFA
jgi:hypothetical protein